MQCEKCQKDFEAGVEAAYKLGLSDGEGRLRDTINKILRNNNVILNANRRLAQELLRLDLHFPLVGITITFKKAKSMLGLLPEGHSITRYLQKLIGEKMSSFKS